jgi:hypothetical protein
LTGKFGTILLLGTMFLYTLPAKADHLSMWSWSSTVVGIPASGTVDFSTQVDSAGGFDLVIVLVNNAMTLPTSSSQVLDGVYFDLTSGPGSGISMYSATADLGLLNSGSYQTSPTAGTAGTNICAPGAGGTASSPNSTNCTLGGGWEAAYGASGVGGGANATQQYGIGTTGQGGAFNGNGTTGTGSFDYGIAPVIGINPTKSGGLSNAYPAGYVYEQGTFVLRGFTTQNIIVTNVEAAYGTAPEGTPAATNVASSTPEPPAISLFGGGALFLGLGLIRRRRR